jgi:Zn-finger nucleic acid-binding protein
MLVNINDVFLERQWLFYKLRKNNDMNCPNCNEVLVMSERQGVEIDYCPKCRGVWLDRGELDKIIDKVQATDQGTTTNAYNAPGRDEYYDSTPDRNDYYNKDAYKHRRKKKGFLGDLFDFD